MFRTDYPHPELDTVLFSGDVLFAGSIGRTDLPGGSHADMLGSLRTKVLPLPDSVAVLPGHGPQTTMARERAQNPYLQASHLQAEPS
jgi:hydroxyacylglutathione hydrolase